MNIKSLAKDYFNLNITPDMEAAFERYYKMLTETNKRFNLTAITERNEVYIKHFLDSLAAAPLIAQGASVCDAGSGAGFPGIPLAITRPDLNILLLDSLQKRVNFLTAVIEKLNLKNCRAVHARAEDAARALPGGGTLRETFDCTVARALAALNTCAEYALPLTRAAGAGNPAGVFIAYKGGNVKDEINAARNAVKILGGDPENIGLKEFTLPDDGQSKRALVIIKKISETPPKYPRRGNKAKTDPL